MVTSQTVSSSGTDGAISDAAIGPWRGPMTVPCPLPFSWALLIAVSHETFTESNYFIELFHSI